MKSLFTILLAFYLLNPSPVLAGDIKSSNEIVVGLEKRKTKDRGIPYPNRPPDPPPSVTLTINFDYDSATLTPDGRLQVGNLARALKDERIKDYRVRIEGHTDGQGSDQYNQTLSRRRAEAVRDALTARYGIAFDRLETRGFGKSQLLNPNDPAAPENRRVRVVSL